MKKSWLPAIVVLLMTFPTVASAQDDIGEQLRQLVGDNAKSYVSPLIQGWTAGLNSGIYHTADLHGVLGFDVQIKLTGSILQDADKKYKFQMPATITYNAFTLQRGTDYPAEVEANTIVGDKVATDVFETSGSIPGTNKILTLPPGLDLPTAPLLMPQVSIGLPFGLEVTGRFLPTTKLQSYGKVNYVGFGIRHDIDQYIPLMPVDIAVHFMTQKFNYEDASGQKMITASATAYGVEASKKLLFLTVYGGFQLESSSMDIGPYTATFTEGTQTRTIQVPTFTIEGKNKSRMLVGVRLLLLFINVHADYSIASTPMVTLGAGISFR